LVTTDLGSTNLRLKHMPEYLSDLLLLTSVADVPARCVLSASTRGNFVADSAEAATVDRLLPLPTENIFVSVCLLTLENGLMVL